MDRRRILAIILLALAILIIISVPVWFFTPLGNGTLRTQANLNAPPLAPLALTPRPIATPQAVLTPAGAPGRLSASEFILVDADTGTILYEKNAEKPLPMASTTKIMTALIPIQAGNLDQVITVRQMFALDRLEYDSFNREAMLLRSIQGTPYADLRPVDRVGHEIDREECVKT